MRSQLKTALLQTVLGILAPISVNAQMEQFSHEDYQSFIREMDTVRPAVKNPLLRKYLYSLKPGTENKSEFITALRVAKDASAVKSGSLLFYSVPAMSELQRLPDTYPADGKFLAPVRIISAKDEYEPGSFVLYPLAEQRKAVLTLSDIKTSDGTIFPKSNIDIKVIKVWYQNKNGWYSYFGDMGNKLTPELLLNDENLVKVDTKKEQNFGRMTAKDGSVTYQWINAHPRATRRPSDYYYSCDMFQAMRPEFSDAPTLQPISLKTGEFKQIFVTVHTAKDQPAGLYKGTISVDSAKDGKKLAAIPVEIRVLPFELPAPCSFKNPEKKMLVMFYNYTYFHKIKELNGGDQKLAEKQMYETLRDQVQHGQDFHWMNGRCSNGDGDYAFETTVELMKKAGCRMDFNSIIPGSGPNMQQTVQIAKNYAERIYGHHNVVQGYGDEPSAQWCIDARKYMEAFQKEKMGFVLAGKLQVFHTLTPYLTLYNMAESPEMENATDRWNKAEGDYVAWYAAQHVGSENPAYNRRQYGLTPYLAGFSAFCNYAHHYGSWNDRIDDAYKPMVFAYGSGNGVIDTLQWEGFREGLDDIRYATYMKRLALKAIASDDFEARKTGKAALMFFSEFEATSTDMNFARLQIIDNIMKLRNVLKIQ